MVHRRDIPACVRRLCRRRQNQTTRFWKTLLVFSEDVNIRGIFGEIITARTLSVPDSIEQIDLVEAKPGIRLQIMVFILNYLFIVIRLLVQNHNQLSNNPEGLNSQKKITVNATFEIDSLPTKHFYI